MYPAIDTRTALLVGAENGEEAPHEHAEEGNAPDARFQVFALRVHDHHGDPDEASAQAGNRQASPRKIGPSPGVGGNGHDEEN